MSCSRALCLCTIAAALPHTTTLVGQEQLIFEYAVANCVDVISHVLPEPFAQLVTQTTQQGLDDKMAQVLRLQLHHQ